MSRARPWIRGDWVQVRSAAEIAATLDAEGRLEGLPFMPEMAVLCGRRLRVFRRARKTCVEGLGLRRLPDAVLLEGARCDGGAHDGCQRNCLMFWKTAWLKPAADAAQAPAPDDRAALEVLERLPTRAGERYICQSTELGGATRHIPKWDLLHLVDDLRHGQLSPRGFVAIALRTITNLIRRKLGLPELGMLCGPEGPPPRVDLALQPGDRVRVRSAQAIRDTLDPTSKTAGLSFEPEMGRYVEGIFEVDFPVERIIHEETGKMVRLKQTVALKGLSCTGSCVKNCPRANTLYWREAWLERAAPMAAE